MDLASARRLIDGLSAKQLETLRIIIQRSSQYRGCICPKGYLNSSSARSLERLGLIAERGFPVKGWKLDSVYGPIVTEVLGDQENPEEHS
jgi:hypothetical protein